MNSTLSKIIAPAGGIVVGAGVGSMMTRARFTDVLFAMNGALGAGAGLVAGQFVAPQLPISMDAVRPYTGLVLAMAVPMAVEGRISTSGALIGASVFAGAWAAERFVVPMIMNKNGLRNLDPAGGGKRSMY